MTAVTITFRTRRPGGWAGNGFGYETATYDVLRESTVIGRLEKIGVRWQFWPEIDGVPHVSMGYAMGGTFNKAKAYLRVCLS